MRTGRTEQRSQMMTALDSLRQLSALRLETALSTAALPSAQVVRVPAASRDGAALPPLTLALGGRLHKIIEDIVPDPRHLCRSRPTCERGGG